MSNASLRLIKRTLVIVGFGYTLLCIALYCFQEKVIFPATALTSSHQFHFKERFEEKLIPTAQGYTLHGIWFPLDSAKGTIFYLHGNGGTAEGWGWVAETYVKMGYQVFLIDYPGYGKSGGGITDEEVLFNDVQTAYDSLCRWVPEKDVIAMGYSLGTGLATRLASTRQPKMLLLHAPYFNLKAMMRHRFPFVPTFLLRYQLRTSNYLPTCTMPVIIFHGDMDEVIPVSMGQELRAIGKPQDSLIILKGQGHMGMTENPAYMEALRLILDQQSSQQRDQR